MDHEIDLDVIGEDLRDAGIDDKIVACPEGRLSGARKGWQLIPDAPHIKGCQVRLDVYLRNEVFSAQIDFVGGYVGNPLGGCPGARVRRVSVRVTEAEAKVLHGEHLGDRLEAVKKDALCVSVGRGPVRRVLCDKIVDVIGEEVDLSPRVLRDGSRGTQYIVLALLGFQIGVSAVARIEITEGGETDFPCPRSVELRAFVERICHSRHGIELVRIRRALRYLCGESA